MKDLAEKYTANSQNTLLISLKIMRQMTDLLEQEQINLDL